MPSIHIIYASTSGNTEYVVDQAVQHLQKAALRQAQDDALVISKQRAELASTEDFLKGDILLLAAGSWNTGGVEGQLNPHMHELLKKRATAVDLGGKKVALIGLGDDRYRYTVGAMAHLIEFVETHNGVVVEPVLKIVNEPYGQEEKVEQWISDIRSQISAS